MGESQPFLQRITKDANEVFKNNQNILSFNKYLDEVMERPECHLRNCAQYFHDLIEHFGSCYILTPAEKFKRYKIFDADFADQQGRIFGHEKVQHEIVKQIKNFVQTGRVDKLLLLHGPNGSAKTSIVQALCQGAEFYSRQSTGALYQFSWVFPKKENLLGPLGFKKEEIDCVQSYAQLPSDAINSRVPADLKDHPLLLLTPAQRQEFYSLVSEKAKENKAIRIPEILKFGELSHKNRQIFDALLSYYNGDLARVFKHVRVERFYFSRRYKIGVSAVEPQMSVDASIRQLPSDFFQQGLPGSLGYLCLFETLGPLVEANRGLIEYSDLLKRPIDAWKYLLIACEQAQVSIGTVSLFFDLLMIATSNELHLTSFREYPDWPSFKGRIELIKVPYLLRSVDEQKIYLHKLKDSFPNLHIAPHSIEMVARWAVLTRLEPLMPENYPAHLKEIVGTITPSEKLELYDAGEPPARLSQTEAKELTSLIPKILAEHQGLADYEGRYGASPREVRMMILNAAQDIRFDHISVTAVFDQIRMLMQQKSSYEFLRRNPIRGYRDAEFLLRIVEQHYLEILNDEIRSALGLCSKESYYEIFNRYIMHVSAWTKKEKLYDPRLGHHIEADENFMKNIEKSLVATNETYIDFREHLIAKIGAFRLENPEAKLELSELFASHLKRIKTSHYEDQNEMVLRSISVAMALLQGEADGFERRLQERAENMLRAFYSAGYNKSSARCALSYFLNAEKARGSSN